MTNEEILEQFVANYNESVKADKAFLALWDRAKKSNATYADADRFAVAVGNKMAKAFDKTLADSGLIDEVVSRELAQTIVPRMATNADTTVGAVAKRAQAAINKRGRVGLNVLASPQNQSRVDGLVTFLSDRVYSEIQEKFGQSLVNYSQSVSTSTMKTNIKAQEAIGVKAIIERVYDGRGLHDGKEPCQWCIDRAGTWTYEEARDNGVFERHDGCECTITYQIEGDDVQLQTDWKTNTWQYLNG